MLRIIWFIQNAFLKLFMPLIFTLSLLAVVSPVDAKVLVISPHPDDDILTSSGVIHRSITHGEGVYIVYITNGDFSGGDSGYIRQAEAVTAQGILGLTEDNLIFLGYPDGYLINLLNEAPDFDDIFITPHDRSFTYGNRGLGRSDYHTYRFGTPAAYNMDNLILDLQDILTWYFPDHIIVTTKWDAHDDHSISYKALRSALDNVFISHPEYNPTIHTTIVWDLGHDDSWPNPIDPTVYFAEPPNLSLTDLVWDARESLDVPLAMQSSDLPENPKYQALEAHVSQGGVSSYGGFIHKDEFFWVKQAQGVNQPPVVNTGIDQEVIPGTLVYLNGTSSFDPDGDTLNYKWEQVAGSTVLLNNSTSPNPEFIAPDNMGQSLILTFELRVNDGKFTSLADSLNININLNENIAPLASIVASSENAETGQLAVKAVDGIIDGYPGDYSREWATEGEGNGAWIRLNWSDAYSVNRLVLYDRPNSDDHIQSAILSFSDGTTLQVGPLDNGGGSVEYSFPFKTINSLHLTVDQVGSLTENIGLAEIEVFGVLYQPGGNHIPVADAGTDQSVSAGSLVQLAGSGSSDPDGDALTYAWIQTAGTTVQLTDPNIANPSFTAPTGLVKNEMLVFELLVNDGQINSVADTVAVTVNNGNIVTVISLLLLL